MNYDDDEQAARDFALLNICLKRPENEKECVALSMLITMLIISG